MFRTHSACHHYLHYPPGKISFYFANNFCTVPINCKYKISTYDYYEDQRQKKYEQGKKRQNN
jgi:hypothetical protein